MAGYPIREDSSQDLADAPQQIVYLFDHLVCAGEQRRRELEAERFCGVEIDDQVVLGRCLDGQVAGLLAVENAIDVRSRASILVDRIRPIRDQPTAAPEERVGINSGQAVPRRRCDDQLTMNRCRALAVTINPTFDLLANAVMPRSISPGSRMASRITSTPTEGAMDWIATHWPIPAGSAASRKTAARVTPGAASFSNSRYFPLMPYSNVVKPVTLPPGRARLSTKPAPTGSGVCANTIGTARVACSNAGIVEPAAARMTSGASATNSAASLR